MARTKNRYRMERGEETPHHVYRTGIYSRLSKERTENWRNKSQSLETQESLARAFAKEKGLTIIKCYIDYEYSGRTFNRPAFQEMLDDIKKGVINCIVIRDLSRLGRNYIEMGRLIDKVFPFMGVRFISITDNLDTLNGLEDKKSFEVEIKNLVNDLYAKDISKKVTAYHIHQASQGYFIGGFPPYGYKLDKQEKGVKLVIDPLVSPVLTTVFEKLKEGQSIIATTKYLNVKRIAIPTVYRQTGQLIRLDSDRREWQSGNLLRLLKNPVYQGHLVQRKTNQSLSEKDYIRFEHAHEAYISSDDFKRILAKISDRKSVRRSVDPRTPNRYQGLVYAKTKSTQMVRKCRHFSNHKSDYDYYYFIDYLYGSEELERQTVYISENALDKIVLNLVQTEMERLGTVKTLLPRLEAKRNECLKIYDRQMTRNQRTLMQLQAELTDLYASFSLNRFERKQYLLQKKALTAKMETISQEIAHCETSVRKIEEEHCRQVSWLKSLAKCQRKAVLSAELLQTLIERIEVDVDKVVTVTFTCQIGGGDHD